MKYLNPKSVLVSSCWMWSVFLAFVIGTQVPLKISIVRQSPRKVAQMPSDSFSAKVEVPVVNVSDQTPAPVALNLPVDNSPPNVAPPTPTLTFIYNSDSADQKPVPPPSFPPVVESPSERPQTVAPPLVDVQVPSLPTSPPFNANLGPTFIYSNGEHQTITIGELLASLKGLIVKKADCEKRINETTLSLKTHLAAVQQELAIEVSKPVPQPSPVISIDELVSELKKAKALKVEMVAQEEMLKRSIRTYLDYIQKEAKSLGVMDVEPFPGPPSFNPPPPPPQ
jgi:hypothetical protein